MKIIFCFASEPEPTSAAAVLKYAPQAEFVQTPGLFGYNKAIASRWTGEDDLVVIEGDKEIHSDVIPSFQSCDQPWCTYACDIYPAPYTRETRIGLSCAKFSADCQLQVPVDSFCRPDYPMREPCRDCNGAGCWRYLDTRIATAIVSRCIAFDPHVHGRIKHHHNYPPDWAQQRGLEPNAHSK